MTTPTTRTFDEAADLARESQALTPVYAAFDTAVAASNAALRASVEHVEGSTEVYEREVRLERSRRSTDSLQIDPDSLVLGRLEFGGPEPSRLIGRVGLRSSDRDVLLVDWRAPLAEGYFQATSGKSAGIRRRRVFHVSARRVVEIDDDVYDDSFQDGEVRGEGSLLRALSRSGDGYMHDIVQTIQAEQDAVIRLNPLTSCVVTGAAGTGKTVVALHRVSFVLYHRAEALRRSGALIVGPSERFGAYISRVLPALGETSAEYRSLASLVDLPSSVSVSSYRDVELAAWKGRASVKASLRRTLVSLLPDVSESYVMKSGVNRYEIAAPVLQELRYRALIRAKGDLNAGARAVFQALTKHVDEIAGPRLRGSSSAVNRDLGYLADELVPQRSTVEVWSAICSLSPADVARAFGVEFSGGMSQRVAQSFHSDQLSIDDVPLWYWIGRHLGVRGKMRWDEEEESPSSLLAAVDTVEDRVFSRRSLAAVVRRRKFGLIVVDEAQDLTGLQWEVLKDQSDSAQWIIVGDDGQSLFVEGRSIRESAANVISAHARVQYFTLDVNYRTPVEISRYVEAVTESRAHSVTFARESGEIPWVVQIGSSQPISSAVLSFARGLLGDGRTAVIAPPSTLDAMECPSDIADWLDPISAKGLEWDQVIVLLPEDILRESGGAVSGLYVALTRATQALVVVSRSAEFVVHGLSREARL